MWNIENELYQKFSRRKNHIRITNPMWALRANISTRRNQSPSNSKLSRSVRYFRFSHEKKIFLSGSFRSFRPTACDYSLLGCNWTGPYHSLSAHREICEHPSKTGLELIETIRAQKHAHDEEKKCLETVVDLLSLNQIGVSGKWDKSLIRHKTSFVFCGLESSIFIENKSQHRICNRKLPDMKFS